MKAVFWGIESDNRILNKGPKLGGRQSYSCLTCKKGREHKKSDKCSSAEVCHQCRK